MLKIVFCLVVVLTLFVICGCQTQETYINGNSSILSSDWRSQVVLQKTTEQDLVGLLGKPTMYYHHNPKNDDKYLFYVSRTSTISTSSLPIFSKVVLRRNQKIQDLRLWFLISKDIVVQKLEAEKSEDDPNLTNFLASSDSKFPHCDKMRCKPK